MRSRRLLVITYHYAPMPFLGGDRWGALVKYLRRLGHDVTVLTTAAFGTLPGDREAGVVRTRDLNASPTLRRVMRRPDLGPGGRASATTDPSSPLLTQLLVPDAYVASWVPSARRTARRLLGEHGYDCLITTSPPESAHLIALALGRSRPAWVADLRDGWTFEPLRPAFPTPPQRSLDRALERAVVRRADAVVAATEPIAADLEARLGVPAAWVTNAWDPDLESDAANAEPPALDPERASLVYTGTLGGVRGHEVGGLIDALATITRERPGLVGRVELVIAGGLTDDDRRRLDPVSVDGLVRTVGPLDRPTALALQRRADALLLITSAAHRSVATGKLFEYLAAGRPILALAGDNAAARIVRETGAGVVVRPDDPAAIVAAITQIADGAFGAGLVPRGLDRYSYPAPAEGFAEQIERAIAQRAR